MKRDHRQTTLSTSDGVDDLQDINWTFEGTDTQYLTHGLHNYPARMVPEIPDTLLGYYKNQGVIEEGDLVYDPFSGSGTTAVEGRLHGLNAEGNDINPFAVMLSKAKAIPLERGSLSEARDALINGLSQDLRDVREEYDQLGEVDWLEMPEVRDGWFPEPQIHELTAIRDRIDSVEDAFGEAYARFFRIVLSHTTRKVSYQRNGEYKRYRLSEEDRVEHNPDVEPIFTKKLKQNMKKMQDYSNRVDHDLDTTIHYSDSRTAVEDVGENQADIVITSPPYGDHQTTVAYGQFSQDPALLTGKVTYDEMKDVDKTGLGGRYDVLEPVSNLEEYSPTLKTTLDTLREKDGRSDDALDFFRDYYAVMEQVAKITKTDQPVAWVVANRTMSRVNIPTHLITRELCESLEYEFDVNLPREIPTKTLPWENAPENVEGTKGNLMANENIVILRAP
ncbi:adenine-specific DNA methylase [Halorubrum salipaludis]|uniref:site-specific DNA-methyltransferase (cytosine-N(4)-specific) n=1 Tax=Halorubrum salipaludis TaxID=2032630 RepID=A0A2A2F5Z7_9EURY|nr:MULTISPECIES: DNA methyltransferase [Halorubrum]PAU80876.1 adenine-specific DNA methylase [Halorubrum salipaludis]